MKKKDIPITYNGYIKLVKKLKYLRNIARKKAINKIAIAKDHGDLSENAEYIAAKEHCNFVEKEISNICYKLSTVKIVHERNINKEKKKIFFGSETIILCKNNSKEKRIIIVGEYETNWKENKISIKSP
jgi:transcription elongation factor GreA